MPPPVGGPNGIFTVQPYDASKRDQYARVRRNPRASVQPGHGTTSPSAFKLVDQALVALFYIPTRTRFCHRLARLLNLPVSFKILPHRTPSTPRYTEMVATPLDSCQLNIARR